MLRDDFPSSVVVTLAKYKETLCASLKCRRMKMSEEEKGLDFSQPFLYP